ncbi:MAG: ABC-2 type transporter [Candidatus Magnetoglobus multicellularis str. Araruama]|uniref:ABC-2 type transporter n=1 Tax=Candidatus Magnetoglobus multicellularis str. Araruama TaxID=890399 RepID=A0A1V1P9C3_9BACT|nr:MAG: ABC-2 type transporter [Candidatus Magnetoglobus multicellularis str. Araruama]
MGREMIIDGHTYMEFLIPGLMAMSSMTQAFAIATEINVARFYWHIFEEFQAAPVSNVSYVSGEVLAGMTRAFCSVVVILFLGSLFGVRLSLNLYFWAALFLNSFVFASLAVGMAMLVKSHADQGMLTNFIITPMAFFGRHIFSHRSLTCLGPKDYMVSAPFPCIRCCTYGIFWSTTRFTFIWTVADYWHCILFYGDSMCGKG